MSTLPSPKCLICNDVLESVEHYLHNNEYVRVLSCPTKDLLPVNDLLRQKPHYKEFADHSLQEFIYSPYRIVLNFTSNTTDIWFYQESQSPRVLLTFPVILSLPWNNESAVRENLNLFLTFS